MPKPTIAFPVRSAARLVAAVLVAFAFVALAGNATSAATPEETELFNATNAARASYGLGALQYDPAASTIAAGWSAQMASSGTLSHNPNLTAQVNAQVTTQWTRLGENVGVGPTVGGIQSAFMGSSGHRNNILGDYNRVGVGVARDGSGRLWVTVVFLKAPPLPAAPPPPPVVVDWYLRNNVSPGAPEMSFSYGAAGYRVLSCDWDGNGTDTIGVYVNGSWYLRNDNSPGAPQIAFAYGAPGYQPVCGDWDGNGTDTIGVFLAGTWYLRLSNNGGPADIAFGYGTAGYTAVAGDWDGNGTDTVGVFTVDGNWYLRNSNGPGGPNIAVNYGTAGYSPVAGDWDGNNTDTLGVFVDGRWYLRNSNTGGLPNLSVTYGTAGYAPVVGDWDGNGADGFAVAVHAG